MFTGDPVNLRRLLRLGPQGWPRRRPRFTAREVRQLLREGGASARGQAVSRCLARPTDWLPPAPGGGCDPLHQRYLTRIVFWYARGDTPRAICRRLRGDETTGGVEWLLEDACARIAGCLNRTPLAYGLQPTP